MFKGLGGLGDMGKMMKAAQETQEKMARMQENLALIEVICLLYTSPSPRD